MNKTTRILIIYKNCIGTALAKVSAYRLDFALSMLMALLWNALFPIVTILIYNAGQSFPGWDFYEVLLVQSVFMLSSGLAYLFFNGVLWATMHHVEEGSFETVLLKPVSPIFYLIVTNFDPECFGMVIGGGAMFAFALYNVGVVVDSAAVLQFLLMFTAGFCVMAGINLLMAAMSFKWVGNSRITEIFDSIMDFGKFPSSVFPAAIRGFTSFVIPVGMVGFFPASALLGRADMMMTFSIVPCLLFLLSGIGLYSRMIRRYEGVGG
ncbi:MAG: ABC-2 family transporter protein [Oscillospiraceae bacterium]|nr:ABC-2 family transporter protein [Oscillospiraceae bacterium]